MITVPAGVHIYLACGITDMRKGFDSLSLLAQEVLKQNPFAGHLFAFRGRRGDLIKILYWDGQGFCLFAKRLEKGRFTGPVTKEGACAGNTGGRGACTSASRSGSGEEAAAQAARSAAAPRCCPRTCLHLSGLRRGYAQSGRGRHRNPRIRPWPLRSDPPYPPRLLLPQMRGDGANGDASAAHSARSGGSRPSGACADREVLRSPPALPAG